MDEKTFDQTIVGAVGKAVNSGIEPCVIIGLLEATKLDVYHHMKNARRRNKVELMSQTELEKVLHKNKGQSFGS